MADWLADLEQWGKMRNKLNNFNKQFRITDTDLAITAGAVTSIPVTDFPSNVLFSGDVVILEDRTTYELHSLTLTANYTAGTGTLAVSSYTFATDIPVNSVIYYPFTSLLALLRTP